MTTFNDIEASKETEARYKVQITESALQLLKSGSKPNVIGKAIRDAIQTIFTPANPMSQLTAEACAHGLMHDDCTASKETHEKSREDFLRGFEVNSFKQEEAIGVEITAHDRKSALRSLNRMIVRLIKLGIDAHKIGQTIRKAAISIAEQDSVKDVIVENIDAGVLGYAKPNENAATFHQLRVTNLTNMI